AASAHFLLDFPNRRGFDDDNAANFPCGGFDTPSSNRTSFPLSGGPIQLDMHHTSAHVQVLLGIGNDPGSAYNIVLRPTFLEMGPNNFCMSDVNIPSSANLTAGMNATIQVVTNGDPDGGLYQARKTRIHLKAFCADITITDAQLSSDVISANCKNSTGVTTKALTGAAVNANQTTESTSSDGSSTSASGSASAASSTATGAAARYTMATWAVGALGAA
ncbi:GPI anchored protein, partial [Saccharata proteae CBS 121410]